MLSPSMVLFRSLALVCMAILPLAAPAQERVRARDLGVAPGIFTPGQTQRHHRCRRRARRPGHAARRRQGAHRGDRDPAAWRQRLSFAGAGGAACRQRLRQVRRQHPGRRAGRTGNPDPADLHAVRVEGGRCDGRLDAGTAGHAAGALDQSGRGRDQRWRPQRHPRAADHRRCGPAGAGKRDHRAGAGRQRRRRHRDHRIRMERRHRHFLARAAGLARRLDRGRAGADQFRWRAAGDGRAGGSRTRPLFVPERGRPTRCECQRHGRRPRRRFGDHRHRHRCAAQRPQPQARGLPGDDGAGPHRQLRIEWQRRLRAGVLDRRFGAPRLRCAATHHDRTGQRGDERACSRPASMRWRRRSTTRCSWRPRSPAMARRPRRYRWIACAGSWSNTVSIRPEPDPLPRTGAANRPRTPPITESIP